MESQDGVVSVSLLEEKAESDEVENKSLLRRTGRVLGFILVYFTVLLPTADVAYLLPTFRLDLSSWTQAWPWSTFAIWVLCMVAGFTFVTCITEQRTNPFKNRFGKYQCFILLMVKSPLVYLCGPIRALHSPGTADQTHTFVFNAWFVIFYFVGLQFTYLDKIMIFRMAGDKFGSPSLWKTYTRNELLFIFPIILLIVACVAVHLYLIVVNKLVIWYAVFYGIIALAMVVPTVVFRKSHYLHMHHYAIFGLLIPFFAFPNLFSLAWLGLVSGIYVEGIGRWGMAWFWYPGAQRAYIQE